MLFGSVTYFHRGSGKRSNRLVSCLYMDAQCEYVFLGICGQRMPKSDCACAQSDLGISCPLIESLATVEHNVVWQCSDMDIYRLPLPRRHLFSCRGSYISNPVVI